MKFEVCGYEHTHLHTEFSLLDGYQTTEEAAKRAKAINQQFLCISDHGMMAAVPSQIRECEKNNLHPIFACELYVNPAQTELKEDEEFAAVIKDQPIEYKKLARKSYHLLAVAYNNIGYSNLVALSSWGWTKGFYRRPRVNHEQLMRYKEGIIFTSCCYNSEIGQAFDREGEDAGFSMIEKYIEMFGEHFYLEIMLLDFPKQKPYNKFIIKASEKYHIPIILTNDCHYAVKEDSHMQRLMLMIQTGKTLADFKNIGLEEETDFFELQDKNLWMKSEDELNEKWFSDYQDAVDYEIFKQAKRNTVELCRKAKGVILDRTIKLPKFDNEEIRLRDLILKGFKQRQLPATSEYLKRIEEEYELICHKGFASYFLIQKMMVDEARRICPELLGWGTGHEAIGPGRGCNLSTNKIMIKDGTCKQIKDVQVGDFVLTRDGSWQRVLRTLKYDISNERLIKIKSYYGEGEGIGLTFDHKVFVEKGIRPRNWHLWKESTKKSRRSCEIPNGNLEWLEASKIEKGDWVFIPNIQDNPKKEIIIDLAKYSDQENIWHDENYVYHDYINSLTKKLRTRKKINRYIKLDQDWLIVLGIFTGDGWLRSNNEPSVGFCFHSAETYAKNLVKYKFSQLGVKEEDFTLRKHKSKQLFQLWVKNKFIQKWFKDMYDKYQCTSKTKHIPDFIFDLPHEDTFFFLRGYFFSDGNQGQYKANFSTSSNLLADQTRNLLLRNGIPSSFKKSPRFDKRSGKTSEEIKITIPHVEGLTHNDAQNKYVYHKVPGGILLKVREIEYIDGEKEVYDLHIENNHNYSTSTCLVHNSGVGALTNYVLGVTDVDPIEHDLLFWRFLSPARGGKQMKLRFSS